MEEAVAAVPYGKITEVAIRNVLASRSCAY
jgi:hypothetical protein